MSSFNAHGDGGISPLRTLVDPNSPTNTNAKEVAKPIPMVDAQDALLPSAQGSTGRKRELSEDDANLAERKRSRRRMNNAPALPIPSSWESATPADRMMIALKEAGEPWRAIREAWTEETGHEVGATTLPRRYSRIRDQMMHWKDSDTELLRTVSKEVEENSSTGFQDKKLEKKFSAGKFAAIAEKFAEAGGARYSGGFVQKQLGLLEVADRLAREDNDDLEEEE